MLKVILEYSDYCTSDRKNIFKALAKNNINILQTKEAWREVRPQVIITIDSTNKLNTLLFELNSITQNGVIPKKVIEFDEYQKCSVDTYHKWSKLRRLLHKVKCWINS